MKSFNQDFTFVFFSEFTEVIQELRISLDTVNISRLQAAPTKPRHIAAATTTVLLAQQRVDAAVTPLCGSPGITVEQRRELLKCAKKVVFGHCDDLNHITIPDGSGSSCKFLLLIVVRNIQFYPTTT